MSIEFIVLSYPKLKERIEKFPADKEKALKNLSEIKANYNKRSLSVFIKSLDVIVKKLYDGIHLLDSNIDMNSLLVENNVVLVPNHQSHADYVAINYIFYKTYKQPLYVAGGENLNIFPIGNIFKKCACFFIKRSFANNIVYKLTLEAYLYYLLIEGKPIEFFFEGGRSRSGKLLPPRYGLYSMLLEAHSQIPIEKKRPLLFLPVSIVHQYVPEQKSLVGELSGVKKKKESTTQLFGLLKLFKREFGKVYIRFGNPVKSSDFVEEDGSFTKEDTQNMAFACFREVAANMSVNPSSLLALVLLDEPSGAMKWKDILEKCKNIVQFCTHYNIPITDSLKKEEFESSMERALDLLLINKKINVLGNRLHGHVFYSIKPEVRIELLYYKNNILHHFLVPSIINNTWINVFNGTISSIDDLKMFLHNQRVQLKHEFYLPTVKELFTMGFKVLSDALDRPIRSFDDLEEFSHEDLYAIGKKLGSFSRMMSFLYEGHYISLLTILDEYKKTDGEVSFSFSEFIKSAEIVHQEEIDYGKRVKFPESFGQPLLKSAMNYLVHEEVLRFEDGKYCDVNFELLDIFIKTYAKDLLDHLSFNMKSMD